MPWDKGKHRSHSTGKANARCNLSQRMAEAGKVPGDVSECRLMRTLLSEIAKEQVRRPDVLVKTVESLSEMGLYLQHSRYTYGTELRINISNALQTSPHQQQSLTDDFTRKWTRQRWILLRSSYPPGLHRDLHQFVCPSAIVRRLVMLLHSPHECPLVR